MDALAAHGTPMAVFSNKPDEFTKLCVARLLPQWQFAAVLGAGTALPREARSGGGAGGRATGWALPPARFSTWATQTRTCRRLSPRGCFPSARCWGFRTADELGPQRREGAGGKAARCFGHSRRVRPRRPMRSRPPDGCHAHACVGMILTPSLMPTQAWAWHPRRVGPCGPKQLLPADPKDAAGSRMRSNLRPRTCRTLPTN